MNKSEEDQIIEDLQTEVAFLKKELKLAQSRLELKHKLTDAMRQSRQPETEDRKRDRKLCMVINRYCVIDVYMKTCYSRYPIDDLRKQRVIPEYVLKSYLASYRSIFTNVFQIQECIDRNIGLVLIPMTVDELVAIGVHEGAHHRYFLIS